MVSRLHKPKPILSINIFAARAVDFVWLVKRAGKSMHKVSGITHLSNQKNVEDPSPALTWEISRSQRRSVKFLKEEGAWTPLSPADAPAVPVVYVCVWILPCHATRYFAQEQEPSLNKKKILLRQSISYRTLWGRVKQSIKYASRLLRTVTWTKQTCSLFTCTIVL